ncbi:MAG: type I DNA topoisomerase [Fimbriimonadaceae bacterium]|nr:type I DNA topoisomerase [Fimbriimonadaceae bacterium]
MPKLVIVESPAKAKTISRFLGADYDVQASYGHVRDLPEKADDIPAEFKKLKWAKLGVNVEHGFEPLYVVPSDKKRHVDALKKASKGVDELLLATDEDREGESISWHVLQLLKPSKSTKVRRIVFHEITPEAIREALQNPRDLDQDLVKAQETRRILDRLYGYTLSPLLWKKVAPRLSAGRVQSVAVRLIVQRERERIAFREAEYWDLEALLASKEGEFKARLTKIADGKIATGKSFDPTTGELREKAVQLSRADAVSLAEKTKEAKPWTVVKVETSPGKESQPPPFMTSTLQQEANRKLRFGSRRTMQVAQGLYEGVDLDGERVGLITYMRTDSLNLAERAIEQARQVIRDLYGPEYVPEKPNRYKTKAKGAQEAHEAIRPTDLTRRPQDVARYLDKDQLALYELIWKRTIACQMPPARVSRTSVEVDVTVEGRALKFGASGKQIVFPGFLRAYVEGSDDPEAELEGKESILPPLKEGQTVDLKDLEAQEHHTKPPARYTEASLVKKLEEEGVGRPSTYASIIGTIQDRGYVFKRGNELVPTFTAFAVTGLLENHFEELVDIAFTARMEEELDDIADGKLNWVDHLHKFFLGEPNHAGLEKQVETEGPGIPFPNIEIGEADGEKVVVRVGRYGPYVQRGEGGKENVASIPDDLAPAELTLEAALELINRKSAGPQSVGIDRASGRPVYFKKGRFGNYLEVGQTEEEAAAEIKPKRVTLPTGIDGSQLNDEDMQALLSLPKVLGQRNGEDVTVSIGQYGTYVKCGAETRNVENWREAVSLALADANHLLDQPKVRRGRAASAVPAASVEAIKEFGKLDGAAGPVKVMPGRYGPYVTDGKTNATIPKNIEPDALSADQAVDLLKARAAAGPTKKRRFTRKK